MHEINNKALNELTYEEMRKEQQAVSNAQTIVFVGSLLTSMVLMEAGAPFIVVGGVNSQQIREKTRMKNYYKKHPEE